MTAVDITPALRALCDAGYADLSLPDLVALWWRLYCARTIAQAQDVFATARRSRGAAC